MPIGPQVVITPARRVAGALQVPGDKSISHRYALLAAIARGRTRLRNYAPGGDCASTLECLRALGVAIGRDAAGVVQVEGQGPDGLRSPTAMLDCGNSGSTMRMLAGVVAGRPWVCTLSGDASLSRRPMRRVVEPLTRMGAIIDTSSEGRPPMTIRGGRLRGIDFAPAVSSAQVKSAVLLAGIQAEGRSRVTESTPTRDHTERALSAFGAVVDTTGATVSIDGGQSLHGLEARVPGDLSSAAFPLVAAAMLPGSDVTIEGVGLNPSRTAILDVLVRFGVAVEAEITESWQGEPVGRVRVRATDVGSVELGADVVPAVIDELPILAVLATAGGELRVTGAGELRVKESDRITSVVEGLRALGADIDELPDGFHARGTRRLHGGTVQARHDHRLAMAFAIAGLSAAGPVTIDGADAAAVSYPGFFADLERLRA